MANHRKGLNSSVSPVARLQIGRGGLASTLPCFYNGEIWSVEPPGCLGSACNDVNESVATASTQGLTCSSPCRRKGQVFWLVSLILKECGIPSDSGQTPKYITLLSSTNALKQF